MKLMELHSTLCLWLHPKPFPIFSARILISPGVSYYQDGLIMLGKVHHYFNIQWKRNFITSIHTWIVWRQGEAMNTTYGAYSALLSIFRACGSTSSIAIFPSEWICRIVSSFVPYIASSCVPARKYLKWAL